MADIDDYGRLLSDRKEAEREVRVIEDRIRQVVQELVNGACGPGVDFAPDELAVGGHDCLKSPIEQCVYDAVEDPQHVSCLFCCLPEDRKRELV